MTAPTSVPLSDWALAADGRRLQLHATGVAVEGQGIVIRGAAGSGKSCLALRLLDRGAVLIADDGLWIDTGDAPFVERPDTATDLIESRGVGLLRAGAVCGRAPLAIAVDLDRAEPERLPPRRVITTGAAERPLILGAGHPALAEALVHMIRHGRSEPGGRIASAP
ncbi:hypothetical protein P6F26_11405 [Roseibacterium sp. SDUM158017]|uniref:HPr kinase/phosphorylase n=1 Tax=Roseicyclus salinarum TaxID=3036773 RepID=UPI002414F98C|nr:hypothetical protein [Roseibacterium sp. SDUM158017]MDG4649052.1 hypothetical protein [Roseibacterium sp. SDUM158017]